VRIVNQVYFCLASILFLLADVQVSISSKVLDKLLHEIPRLRIESFKAGCQVAKKAKCSKEEINQYEADIYKIYSK
jgi:hypothetical protein